MAISTVDFYPLKMDKNGWFSSSQSVHVYQGPTPRSQESLRTREGGGAWRTYTSKQVLGARGAEKDGGDLGRGTHGDPEPPSGNPHGDMVELEQQLSYPLLPPVDVECGRLMCLSIVSDRERTRHGHGESFLGHVSLKTHIFEGSSRKSRTESFKRRQRRDFRCWSILPKKKKSQVWSTEFSHWHQSHGTPRRLGSPRGLRSPAVGRNVQKSWSAWRQREGSEGGAVGQCGSWCQTLPGNVGSI